MTNRVANLRIVTTADLRFGDPCRSIIGKPARYIGNGLCVFVLTAPCPIIACSEAVPTTKPFTRADLLPPAAQLLRFAPKGGTHVPTQ